MDPMPKPRERANMPTARPAGLNLEAFVALMAEMGVEAVRLPDSEPENQNDEALPAGDSATA